MTTNLKEAAEDRRVLRAVWVRAMLLKGGKGQLSKTIRVRDEYTEHEFVMEPGDVKELTKREALRK